MVEEEKKEAKVLSQEELEKRIQWYEKRYGPYIEKRGFHNWKNLFRWPNTYEWTILAMLLMSLFIAFAYQSDVKSCQDTLRNLPVVACSICAEQREADNRGNNQLNQPIIDVSGINLSGS